MLSIKLFTNPSIRSQVVKAFVIQTVRQIAFSPGTKTKKTILVLQFRFQWKGLNVRQKTWRCSMFTAIFKRGFESQTTLIFGIRKIEVLYQILQYH